ncbi:MAG: hypothetical protein ACRD8O_18025 [Bryobacteraceae bacterium]
MMHKRRNILGALLGAVGLGKAAKAADGDQNASGERNLDVPILFRTLDEVLIFPPTGDGVRTGTAVGIISGVTTTNFQFLAVPPPEFKADDLVAITDVDGDQILFRAQVTGRFLAPFGDPTRGPVAGLGGPYAGTYEVLRATGKFGYLVGRKFPCKGLGMNPARQGFLGSVYTEVYTDRFDSRV